MDILEESITAGATAEPEATVDSDWPVTGTGWLGAQQTAARAFWLRACSRLARRRTGVHAGARGAVGGAVNGALAEPRVAGGSDLIRGGFVRWRPAERRIGSQGSFTWGGDQGRLAQT